MLLTLLLAMVLGMSASAKTGKNKVVKVKGKNGTYTYSGSYGDEKYIYHKFSVGQTGVLRITGYEQTKNGKKSGFTVMLFDKNKKRLDVNKENYINYTKGTIKYYVLSQDIAQTSGEVDIQIGDVELTSDVGSAQSVTLSASDDPMLFLSGYLSPGKKATVLTSRTDLKDGFYTAEITTESLQPISLLFARN